MNKFEKKLLIIATLLIGVLANAQDFEIRFTSEQPDYTFVELENDTTDVIVVYNKKVLKGNRVVKQIKCTYDKNDNLTGRVMYKVSHYLIEGKEVKPEDILYDTKIEKRLNTGILSIWPEGTTLTPTYQNDPNIQYFTE
ncbi:hypothetical protein [Tenacibaculum sp.]|uniref:hypothetical protein n=1 Tax=Tenacibaculum sp. TaxID=1906242 RepID=UPI003D12E185